MRVATRRSLRFMAISLAIQLAGGLATLIAMAAEETIELKSGETIKGTVVERTENTIVIEHAIFGRQEIDRNDIEPKEVEEVVPGLFGSRVLAGWSRALGFGLAGSTGNSKDLSINTSLDITRETKKFRGNFSSMHFFSSTRGITSRNQFTMGYLHDFLLGDSRWIVSTAARYDYDDFQVWRHRLSAQLAPGYEIIRNDHHKLIFRAGLGAAHEFGSDPDPSRLDPILAAGSDPETKPEGVFSLDYRWNIDDAQKIVLNTTYFPNWKELPEFRMNSNAWYKLQLEIIDGLSLKVGLRNEYVSDQPGDNNTLNYYGNLVYDF